ncbi:TPA: hypothetical protein DCZ32_00945, partial [Candidatus Uhrbacteria bacterium]|nr:hypothetical protein [Candidatus Uhrbacteria bacterium]
DVRPNADAGGITGANNPMLHKSLSTMIRWFKGRCSYEINNRTDSGFVWQPRFYDRIIRNDESLNKTRNYILSNPFNWEFDRNNQFGIEF